MKAKHFCILLEPNTGRQYPLPLLKWYGGKRKLLPQIIPRLPKEFGGFHEPFIGGGALLFSIKPEFSYISDANPEVINVYNVVKHKPHALIADLGKHKHNKGYFVQLRGADRLSSFDLMSDVARASRFIFLNKTCFNGQCRVNAKGQLNMSFGRYENPGIFNVSNLLACHVALQRTRITHAGFQDVVKVARQGDFVYFDPPYIPLSKSANFTDYAQGGFAMGDQVELRDLCRRLDKNGIHFMVSNSHVPAVFELYDGFRIHTVLAQRSAAGDVKSRGRVREVLVTNY